jgi:hypothetical protein
MRKNICALVTVSEAVMIVLVAVMMPPNEIQFVEFKLLVD